MKTFHMAQQVHKEKSGRPTTTRSTPGVTINERSRESFTVISADPGSCRSRRLCYSEFNWKTENNNDYVTNKVNPLGHVRTYLFPYLFITLHDQRVFFFNSRTKTRNSRIKQHDYVVDDGVRSLLYYRLCRGHINRPPCFARQNTRKRLLPRMLLRNRMFVSTMTRLDSEPPFGCNRMSSISRWILGYLIVFNTTIIVGHTNEQKPV